MSIIRIKKVAHYFAAPNDTFNDKRLSWEARGLMGYLLSKPDNWEVRFHDLENQGPAGEQKLRRMLAELRSAGYINRIRRTRADGTFDWITEIFESSSLNTTPNPEIQKQPVGEKPQLDKTTSGKAPDILSTELTSTELNDDEEFLSLQKTFTDTMGTEPTVANLKALNEMLEEYPFEWCQQAFLVASGSNVLKVAYVKTVLKNWKEHGFGYKPQRKGWYADGRVSGSKQSNNENILENFVQGHSL